MSLHLYKHDAVVYSKWRRLIKSNPTGSDKSEWSICSMNLIYRVTRLF